MNRTHLRIGQYREVAERLADAITRGRDDETRGIALLTLCQAATVYEGPEDGFEPYVKAAIRRAICRARIRYSRYSSLDPAIADSIEARVDPPDDEGDAWVDGLLQSLGAVYPLARAVWIDGRPVPPDRTARRALERAKAHIRAKIE